jgi:23S rRNA-/tRNA-specific pseudouridylate synthase
VQSQVGALVSNIAVLFETRKCLISFFLSRSQRKPFQQLQYDCVSPIKCKRGNEHICFITISGMFSAQSNYCYLQVMLCPRTGRRHQLRVHSCHVGHRIAGDYTYSSGQDSITPRMFLHAQRLVLPNRVKHLDLECP